VTLEVNGFQPTWDSTSVRRLASGAIEITVRGKPGVERVVVVLRIADPSTIGPQSMSNDTTRSELTYALPDRGSSWIWSTKYLNAYGSVAVNQLTGDRIAGDFTAEIESMSGSAERLYVRLGRFNVTF
jgi:hypothetical protein